MDEPSFSSSSISLAFGSHMNMHDSSQSPSETRLIYDSPRCSQGYARHDSLRENYARNSPIDEYNYSGSAYRRPVYLEFMQERGPPTLDTSSRVRPQLFFENQAAVSFEKIEHEPAPGGYRFPLPNENSRHGFEHTQRSESFHSSDGGIFLQKSYTLQNALLDSSTFPGQNRSRYLPHESECVVQGAYGSPSILIDHGASTEEARQIRPETPPTYTFPRVLQLQHNGENEKPSAISTDVIAPMSVDDCEVHPCMNAQTEPSAMTTTDTRQAGKRKRKPAKMHQCEICLKQFPRPSGLKTHMNTHNNYKPFSCTYPGCTRTFTVRSNAKRHLRTHGNNLLDDVAIPGTAPRATVPDLVNKSVINELEHDLRSAPAELKWMPISLSSHTNVVSLNSIQEESDSDWEDAKDDSVVEQSLRALSFPLRPVLSFEAHEGIYEERNSYEEAESYPLLC